MSKKHTARNAKRSEAQIAPSRLNGALSRGPVTPEGKAIVARNAITHGAHAANPVLQGESQEAFDALLDGLTLDSFPDRECPPNVTESCLLRDIASARWRRQRTINMERANRRPRPPHGRGQRFPLSNDNFTLEKLQRQETRLERLESRATAQLQALKAARLKERELAHQERRLALEEAALAAAAAPQNAQNLKTTTQPNNVRNSNSGNNLTVLVPAAKTPDPTARTNGLTKRRKNNVNPTPSLPPSPRAHPEASAPTKSDPLVLG